MKRLLLASFALALTAGAVALSRGPNTPGTNGTDLQVAVESRNPWTHLRLNNDAETFRFLIVSDRTGGHRPGIFSRAVEQINLLQPEFVISVGDLIEGFPSQAETRANQWKEFQGYVSKLQMPFFYVPGNHDVISEGLSKTWDEKFGRRYYHFVYKNTLFLCLNCFDGDLMEQKSEKYYRPGFSKAQLAYIDKALTENPDARWTFVFLHAPVWTHADVKDNGWLEVEKLLEGRNYTVFCGHIHNYRKYQRNGMNYYQFATTGGGSRLRGVEYGEFDQIAWVTMKKGGPVLANVLLDGVLRDDLSKPATEEEGFNFGYGEQIVKAGGAVYLNGAPLPRVEVRFVPEDDPTPSGKRRRGASGVTAADGTFVLTTFKNFDGAQPGKFRISFGPTQPRIDTGKPLANPVPEKYRDPKTSDLTAEVTATGSNVFRFDLRSEK
jgi:hypothetical protein